MDGVRAVGGRGQDLDHHGLEVVLTEGSGGAVVAQVERLVVDGVADECGVGRVGVGQRVARQAGPAGDREVYGAAEAQLGDTWNELKR